MIAKSEPQLMCPITGTPCTGPTRPKPKRAKKTNGKVPAWAQPLDVLAERNKTPAWERTTTKRQKLLKMGEVEAWIREHPEWVAGRLVSEHPEGIEAVYYSEPGMIGRGKNRHPGTIFHWNLRPAYWRDEAGRTRFATFSEWTEAQKTAIVNTEGET